MYLKEKQKTVGHTLKNHSLFYALLEPAVLASVSLRLRDFTHAVCDTRVHPSVLYCPLEKPFAPGYEKKIQCQLISNAFVRRQVNYLVCKYTNASSLSFAMYSNNLR